jgi:hypothetical protein
VHAQSLPGIGWQQATALSIRTPGGPLTPVRPGTLRSR